MARYSNSCITCSPRPCGEPPYEPGCRRHDPNLPLFDEEGYANYSAPAEDDDRTGGPNQ